MDCSTQQCPHHEAIDAAVKRLDNTVSSHCANGGTGHVTRVELTALQTRTTENEKQITDIRTLLIKAGLAMFVAASGGSALAPTIKAVLLKHFGG